MLRENSGEFSAQKLLLEGPGNKNMDKFSG